MRGSTTVRWAAALLLFSGMSNASGDPLSSTQINILAAKGDPGSFETLKAAARSGGDSAEESTTAAVRMGAEGARFAREVFSWGNRSLDERALMGLSQNTSTESLQLLSEKLHEFEPGDQRRESAEIGWAGVFARVNGKNAPILAAQGVADQSKSPSERALYLRVFANSTIDRVMSLRVYRPYLMDPAPELQRAALAVNGAHWDFDALPTLLELENDKGDPIVRGEARNLTRVYLRYGPERPRPGEWERSPSYQERHPKPYDPEGYAAWIAREKDWVREQTKLATGQEPPEPQPAPPSLQIRPAAKTSAKPSEHDAGLPARP